MLDRMLLVAALCGVLFATGCGKQADIDASGPPADQTEILDAIDQLGARGVEARSRAAAVLRADADLARPHLRTLIADSTADPVARALAVRLLGEGDLSADDLELLCKLAHLATPKIALTAREALALHGSPSMSCLIRGLTEGTGNERSNFATLIATMGPDAIDGLLEATTNATPQTLQAIAMALGRIERASEHADRIAPALFEILDSDWPQARQTAAEAFVAIASPIVIDELIARCRGNEPERAGIAADTLGQIGEPGRTAALGLSRDPLPDLRVLGYRALGRWPSWDAGILDLFREALAEPSPDVLNEALKQVARHQGTEIKPLIPALFDLLAHPSPEVRERSEDILVAIGPAVGNRLVRLLHHPNEWVVEHAVEVARQLPGGADSCLVRLDELASSGPESIRENAKRAAKRIRRLASESDESSD